MLDIGFACVSASVQGTGCGSAEQYRAGPAKPPTSDDARPYVFIRGKLFEVPEAYPKGAEGRLVNDQRSNREVEELLAKDIRNACARNTNPRAKPKASDTKSDLIYKRVFGYFL